MEIKKIVSWINEKEMILRVRMATGRVGDGGRA